MCDGPLLGLMALQVADREGRVDIRQINAAVESQETAFAGTSIVLFVIYLCNKGHPPKRFSSSNYRMAPRNAPGQCIEAICGPLPTVVPHADV